MWCARTLSTLLPRSTCRDLTQFSGKRLRCARPPPGGGVRSGALQGIKYYCNCIDKMLYKSPARFALDASCAASLRRFDVATQRTTPPGGTEARHTIVNSAVHTTHPRDTWQLRRGRYNRFFICFGVESFNAILSEFSPWTSRFWGEEGKKMKNVWSVPRTESSHSKRPRQRTSDKMVEQVWCLFL